MHRLAVLVSLSALLILPACQREMESEREAAVATQQPAAGQVEKGEQGQTREAAEFMGQAPKTGDIPETVVLEAKNGNVTLPHREHAGRLECSVCHPGTPGKMPDFNKDKAHPLCMGCHKEQQAGPTKCGECHKKS